MVPGPALRDVIEPYLEMRVVDVETALAMETG